MKDWFARVVLTAFLNWLKKQVDEWMEARATAELQGRANEQTHRENAPLDDDDIDKRLRDGSA
jgi:hypothetical protein